MTQRPLIELAQQGDAAAIAALLNDALQDRGITASSNLQTDCLQVMLVAEEVPDQADTSSLIQSLIADWGLDLIATAKLYGRKTGDEFPAWSQDLELHTPANPAPGPAPSSGATPFSQRRSAFMQSLRTFKFSTVVPYKDVLSPRLYRNRSVRLLLFFGLFPLLAEVLIERADLEQTAWILGIYYASIWAVFLYTLIKPRQFSGTETLKCILFTAFIGVPLLLFFQRFPPFNALYAAIKMGLVFKLIGFVLGVGILEEICKALPVYFFLLRPGKLSDPLTAAFYGAMSGLGFAIAEGAAYSLGYAFGLVRGDLGFGSYVLVSTIRFITVPLFHAILAGIVGYFIGLAAINPARQGAIICIGIAIAAVLHGLYNTFSGGLLGILIIAVSIVLFVSYLQRSHQMIAEVQQAEAQAATSLAPPAESP